MAVDYYTSVVDLSPHVESIEVTIAKGGGFAVTLEVTDENGAGADLTGVTATLYFNYGQPSQIAWVATTVGSQFRWDKTQAQVDALAFTTAEVRLVVAQGSVSATWGLGQARVI